MPGSNCSATRWSLQKRTDVIETRLSIPCPIVTPLITIDSVRTSDPADELRRLYPPILTTAHVAEIMHCTIGDVRDKVHRGELEALRWGQQFRFFREEVFASMTRYRPGDPTPDDENVRVDTERN